MRVLGWSAKFAGGFMTRRGAIRNGKLFPARRLPTCLRIGVAQIAIANPISFFC